MNECTECKNPHGNAFYKIIKKVVFNVKTHTGNKLTDMQETILLLY